MNQKPTSFVTTSRAAIKGLIGFAIALYKFRSDVRGYGDLSKYLSVTAFERMIVLTGEKFGYTDQRDSSSVKSLNFRSFLQ